LCGFFSILLFLPNLAAYQIILVSNETNTYDVTKTPFGNTNLFQFYLFFVLNSSNILSTIFLITTGIKLSVKAKHVRLNDFVYSLYDSLFVFNIVDDYEFLVYYSNFWYILLVLTLNTNIFVLLKFNKKFRSIFLIMFIKIFDFNNQLLFSS